MEIIELKQNIAQNIFFLRTANNLTQSELGARINYSDKAISKWERAEGLPDAYVLKRLSEIFGVSVDYLMCEHTEQNRHVDTAPIRNTKRLISQTVVSSILAVAVLLFIILYLAIDVLYWQIFVYSLPVIFISLVVFSFVWWKGKRAFLYTSLLLWSCIATIYVSLVSENFWELFFVGVPAQIVIFFCYKMGFTISIAKKTTGLFKRKSEKADISLSDEK